MTWRATVIGVLIGVTYAWSPLLVVAGLGFACLLRWARGAEDETERRWLVALLAVAIGLRVAAIFVLFLRSDPDTTPFAFFFGDEEYFIRRSIWLRNLAVGIPTANADALYALDPEIWTSYVWLLATIQLLAGPSPYGVHLVSAWLFVFGALLLYRMARPSIGLPSALSGLAVLLFLPSLFIWSIAVLKEPLFFALIAAVMAVTMAALRRRSLPWGVAALVAVAAIAAAAQSIREGGMVLAMAGSVGGAVMAFVTARRRLLIAIAIVVVAAVPVLLQRHAVQDALAAGIAKAAQKHWDQVKAPGHAAMIFEPSFYNTRPMPGDLTVSQTAWLAAGGLVNYVMSPAPWHVRSRAELAFMPEQVIWYVLFALAPIGLVACFRRDRVLASVLLVYVIAAVGLVAITSGNIGTLVRHRALALPALVWLSSLGLCEVLVRSHGVLPPLARPRAPQRVEA